MTEQWQIVVVALIVSVIAPAALALMTNSSRRAEKREDWKRLDDVAALAKIAAETAAANGKAIRGNLAVIHTLVNSQMTAVYQSEFDARTSELASLRELVDLKRSAGREPTAEVLGVIAAIESKIAELRVTLDERKRQQKALDEQTMASRTASLNEDK